MYRSRSGRQLTFSSYIKELADRINTIEGKLGSGVEAGLESTRRTPVDVLPSPQSLEDSRKRPHSDVEAVFPALQSATGRPVIWSVDLPRPLRPQPQSDSPITFDVNDLAPRPPPALVPKQAAPNALPDDFS